MYVCLCKAITDKEVIEAIDAGADSTEALGDQLGVGTCCGCCRDFTNELIDQRLAETQTYAA
jgi:bacterioferritin-associated ferredoxin